MGSLIGLRHHVDLLDASLLIDLAGETVLTRPFVRRPRRALQRMRKLVMLAREAKRLVAPGQLEELEDLLEDIAIETVSRALVTQSRADMDLLRHLVEPARLIAARETDHRAPLGQLIEPRDFEREPQRIPSGEHVADRPGHDLFRVMENVLREQR